MKFSRTLLFQILFLLVVASVGIFVITQIPSNTKNVQQNSSQKIDSPLIGTWRAEGAYKESNQSWFVEYTFKKDGTYEMKTDGSQGDRGTYAVVKTFEDGSIQISKTSGVTKNTYDQFITVEKTKNTILIDGATFKKQ